MPLRGWLESFADHRASWAQYRTKIGAWRNLLEQRDIDIFSLPSDVNRDRFEHLTALFSGKRHCRRGEIRKTKRPRAIEHDAKVVAAIEGLVSDDNSTADPFGPRFWLLTRDHHLINAARTPPLRSRTGSVVMLADEWIQYIAPFLGADVSTLDPASTFAGLLSSRFIPSLTGRMSLNDLRVFAEPQVASLTDGLSREEACHAVSTAHLAAVAHTDTGKRNDEVAIERLAEFAEKQLSQKIKSGQLIEAEKLEQLRHEHEADTRESVEAHLQQAHEISVLKNKLVETKRYQRSSVIYWVRQGKTAIRGIKLLLWIRSHPGRFAMILFGLLGLGAVVVSGVGASLIAIAVVIASILSVIASDFGQARSNLLRLFGHKSVSERDRD